MLYKGSIGIQSLAIQMAKELMSALENRKGFHHVVEAISSTQGYYRLILVINPDVNSIS
jgi:hypothetical protein